MKTIFALLISFCVLSFPAWIESAFSAVETQGAVTTQSYAGKASVVTGPVRYKAGDRLFFETYHSLGVINEWLEIKD